MSPLFVDRFGRSLWISHLEFDKKAITDGYRNENERYTLEFLNILES